MPDSLDPLIDPSRLAALAKVMVATVTKSKELDAVATGKTVGSVSFVDYVPRNWSPSDLATAEKLTAEVAAFLEMVLRE